LNRFSPSVSVRPRNLRERQKEGIRQELRAAALELFARDGYAATSVDDIVREASLSRSTFFRYFGSKEALLLREAEESTNRYLEILAGRPAHEDRLKALEESLIEFAEELRSDERREESMLTTAIIESDASLRASQEVLRARYREEVARVLAERGYRPEPDIEDVLASAILSQLIELMTERWTSSDDASPARELIRSQFASLRGLVTRRR
jgi:AcrR family transcriptional regulator